jgi:chromosome segregation ATPase
LEEKIKKLNDEIVDYEKQLSGCIGLIDQNVRDTHSRLEAEIAFYTDEIPKKQEQCRQLSARVSALKNSYGVETDKMNAKRGELEDVVSVLNAKIKSSEGIIEKNKNLAAIVIQDANKRTMLVTDRENRSKVVEKELAFRESNIRNGEDKVRSMQQDLRTRLLEVEKVKIILAKKEKELKDYGQELVEKESIINKQVNMLDKQKDHVEKAAEKAQNALDKIEAERRDLENKEINLEYKERQMNKRIELARKKWELK